MTISPNQGGCWICQTEGGEMEFDYEYDTWVHPKCLEKHDVETVHQYESLQHAKSQPDNYLLK